MLIGTAYTINITGQINLTTALLAINLPTGVSLTIAGTDGGGNGVPQVQTVNGTPTAGEGGSGASERGFFVYSGNVTLENLIITNAVAQGGAGGSGPTAGGGGGAGLGGGLFVGGAADVALNNVSFSHDSAAGGTGGALAAAGTSGGGGGGGGGLGGPGGVRHHERCRRRRRRNWARGQWRGSRSARRHGHRPGHYCRRWSRQLVFWHQ